MNLFPTPLPLIGLDIQPHRIKAAQLRKLNTGYMIEHLAAANLPHDIFAEGKISDWDTLQAFLSEWISLLGLQGKPAAIQLPANLVKMQTVQLPAELSEAAIEAEIYSRAQRDFPGVNEALCIDYMVSPTLFFAAARKEYLDQYVNCVNAAGLQVKIADVDIFAVERLAAYALPQTERGTSAVLYVCETGALMIFSDREKIIFHQSWEFVDAEDFLLQLKNQLPMDIHELVYCGPREYFDAINEGLLCAISLNPFARMKFSPAMNEQTEIHHPEEFLIACGLAMREVPVW